MNKALLLGLGLVAGALSLSACAQGSPVAPRPRASTTPSSHSIYDGLDTCIVVYLWENGEIHCTPEAL
jgi:hypothetical protein